MWCSPPTWWCASPPERGAGGPPGRRRPAPPSTGCWGGPPRYPYTAEGANVRRAAAAAGRPDGLPERAARGSRVRGPPRTFAPRRGPLRHGRGAPESTPASGRAPHRGIELPSGRVPRRGGATRHPRVRHTGGPTRHPRGRGARASSRHPSSTAPGRGDRTGVLVRPGVSVCAASGAVPAPVCRGRGSVPRRAGPPPSPQLPNGCFSALLSVPCADRPPMAPRRYPAVAVAPVARRRRMRRVHGGPGRCRPTAVERAGPRAEGARERAIALRFRLAPSQRCFELLLSSLAGSAPTLNALESTRSW
ncbi:hypothetical protein BJ996_006750 [Streptomyces phaeogriseichromatogenes]|nr:hypothetical protein [Streptomyces murinus]